MAEDLKAEAPFAGAGLAPTPEERRRTQARRSSRAQKKRTADPAIYGVLVVLVAALMVKIHVDFVPGLDKTVDGSHAFRHR
jgi:multiple sugar transport system permease protein